MTLSEFVTATDELNQDFANEVINQEQYNASMRSNLESVTELTNFPTVWPCPPA